MAVKPALVYVESHKAATSTSLQRRPIEYDYPGSIQVLANSRTISTLSQLPYVDKLTPENPGNKYVCRMSSCCNRCDDFAATRNQIPTALSHRYHMERATMHLEQRAGRVTHVLRLKPSQIHLVMSYTNRKDKERETAKSLLRSSILTAQQSRSACSLTLNLAITSPYAKFS